MSNKAKILDIFLNNWKPVRNCLTTIFPDLDEETKQDIIQESMLNLLESQTDLDDIQDPFAYLLKMCTRKTYKHLREKKKTASYEMEDVPQTEEEQRVHFPEQALEAILHCVDQLKTKESQLFHLRFLQKKSFDEIATLAGYKNSNVARNAMSRVLDKLRKDIKKGFIHQDWWTENPTLSDFFTGERT